MSEVDSVVCAYCGRIEEGRVAELAGWRVCTVHDDGDPGWLCTECQLDNLDPEPP